MQGQQHDQSPFGDFHQRHVGKAQETVQGFRILQGKPQNEEMEGQEQNQRQTGKPMPKGGPGAGMFVVRPSVHGRGPVSLDYGHNRPQA